MRKLYNSLYLGHASYVCSTVSCACLSIVVFLCVLSGVMSADRGPPVHKLDFDAKSPHPDGKAQTPERLASPQKLTPESPEAQVRKQKVLIKELILTHSRREISLTSIIWSYDIFENKLAINHELEKK